jgi:serine/threonine protein kinase
VEGLYYLVMEHVDGVNLRQALAEGKLEPARALPLVAELCAALQYAHEMGVVHRDVKPENVLLDRQGRVKVADFGLAKLVGQTQAEGRLTGTGQVMGTPHYMAPEQWERPREVDHRADIYSLGVVFYEMLTGELPLGKFAPPSQRAGVDARLDGVVLRAMERQPEQRYQHMSEMKTAVEAVEKSPPKLPGAETTEEDWMKTAAARSATFIVIFLLVGYCCWIGWLAAWWTGSVVREFLIFFALGGLVAAAVSWLVKKSLTAIRFRHHAKQAATFPGLTAPEEALRRLLRTAAKSRLYYPQLSVLPDIDSELLAAARKACQAAPEDRVLAVLDLSGGEGDPALLFGCQRMYWRNAEDSAHPGVRSVAYAELAGRHFVNHGDVIFLGGDLYLCPNEDEAGVAAEDLAGLLYQVRDLMAPNTQARP